MLKPTTVITLFTVLIVSSLFAQAGVRRPMTVDDAINMIRVENVLLSPDGKRVFFSKSEIAWDENKRKQKHYMISSDGGEATQFIGEHGGSKFQFSPDGRYLSFLRAAEGKEQVFWMRVLGGEATKLTKHKSGVVSYKWSTDANKIFFTADEAMSDEQKKEHDNGADAYYVREGANGRGEAQWRNLWVFNLSSMTETRLTDEELIISEFDVSPDGSHVVFAAMRQDLQNYFYLSELYLVDVLETKVIRLTTNNAPETDALWAPDGKSIAYHAPSDGEYELTNGYLWIMKPESGEKRKLSGQNQGEISGLTWMPDSSSLFFNETRRTNVNLQKIDVATEEVTRITNVSGSLRALAFSGDRRKMVYSFSDFDTPNDLYASSVDRFNPVRLTNLNPWIEEKIILAKAEVVRWKSNDGMEIEGVFYLPGDHQKAIKVPLILHIHGGPPGHFSNRFRSNFQVFAGLGYASLGPNIRGSDSYGDGVLTALMGDVGGGEYEDLMSGVDYVIKEGNVDPERLGVRGWSWGGILGSWTITQTDRFKAASLGAMVGSWTAETGPGLSYDLRLHYIGGAHWKNPEEWRRVSSLWFVKNVTTPTLLLHGDRDLVSTPNQALMFFTALKDIGKTPVRYVRFPREPHGFREPRHQRTRDVEEIKWMQKYVLGIDWKPWERKEEAGEKRREND
ncbi:MAG: S9 family peptidase [Acidobacteria bacterium]|nr:S9 family peptidase [Acidobacteriota bacterium]